MNVLWTEILAAREERAARQTSFLRQFRVPLVSFTMNIAGPVKTSPLIRRAFEFGLAQLETALAGCILSREIKHAVTGDECLMAVSMDAAELKTICTSIEDGTPMGRLFDMDVLDADGNKLDRKTERGCIVCGAPGRGCASRRVHSVEELQEATINMISAHFIAEAAVAALIEEVRTTPKLGLVDLRNNGSHSDMDVPMFFKSAEALRPYFRQCAAIGRTSSDPFPQLREAGIEAERTMYAATVGVNTHKGAIYTLGILCAAAGRLLHRSNEPVTVEDLLTCCAEIAGDAAKADLEHSTADTAGLRLYRELGIPGIRGEMAAGLPSIKNISLPAFRNAIANGLSRNEAGAVTLLHLIAHVDDTNLWHRGGPDGAAFAAQAARELLEQGPTMAKIEHLDDAFIARNLSPGGCADLLAATYFVDSIL